MWPNVGQTGVSGRPPRPHQAGGGAFFIIEETRQYESGDNGGAVSPPLTPHMLPRICRATPGTNSYCSPDREYHQAGYVQCTSTELYVIYNTLWNFISKQLLQARSKVSLYLYPFELGKPSREKSAVFLTLFKKPLTPPPHSFEHYVVNFSEGILTKVRKRLSRQLSTK